MRTEIKQLAPRIAHSCDTRALHPIQTSAHILIRTGCDPVRSISISRTTIRRIVFKATITGRIMRRRNHNPISTLRAHPQHPTLQRSIMRQNSVRHGRRRRVTPRGVNNHLNIIGQQHLKGANHRRLRQRVGIPPNEHRPPNPLPPTIIHNRLRRSQNMSLVKSPIQRRPPVARRTKNNLLIRVFRIRRQSEIRRHKLSNINQILRSSRLTSTGIRHRRLLEKGVIFLFLHQC